jgi:hypothetical protein
MTFRGKPESYLPQLQENFAPGVDVIRVVDGPRRQTSVGTSYDLRDCHPYECDCYGSGSPYQIYDDYLKAFFMDLPSKSPYASNFRYQASQDSSDNGTQAIPKLSFEMDFVSALGNTWQYRRHERSSKDVFDVICDQHCCCEMCHDHEHPFGVGAILQGAQPNPLCACHLTNLSYLYATVRRSCFPNIAGEIPVCSFTNSCLRPRRRSPRPVLSTANLVQHLWRKNSRTRQSLLGPHGKRCEVHL